MFIYPARFEEEANGGYSITFRDIPEAITQGDNFEDAKTAAVDALITAMDFYFEDNRTVPVPSAPEASEVTIELPASIATKVLLLNLMLEKHQRPIDLAKAMQIKPQEVTRILDVRHTTKIDTLAAAFKALGKRLELKIVMP